MRAKIATLLFMLSIVTPVHARGPYGSISAAGWSGGAFTDDQTGEFSNCIASASYKSGIIFGVVVSKPLIGSLLLVIKIGLWLRAKNFRLSSASMAGILSTWMEFPCRERRSWSPCRIIRA